MSPHDIIIQPDSKGNFEFAPRSQKALAMFAHEYSHYLNNVSTTAGLLQFAILQSQMALATNTIENDTFPNRWMIPDLPNPLLKEFQQFVDYRNVSYADPNERSQMLRTNAIEVVDRQILPKSIVLPNYGEFKYPVTYINLNRKMGNSLLPFPVVLGSYLFDEGTAFAIDQIIDSDDALNVPLYPYSILTKIFDKYAPNTETYFRLGLATICLSTFSPGDTLFQLLDHLSEFDHISDIDAKLGAIWEFCLPSYEQVIPALQKNLDILLESYIGREVMQGSIRYVADQGMHMIRKRVDDPFFNLRPFKEGKFNPSEFERLLKLHPPCPIIQYTDEMSGIYYEFGNENSGKVSHNSLGQSVGLLMCQNHYLTDHQQSASCPFYAACDFPQRENQANFCAKEPWKVDSFEAPSNTGDCWYRTAVVRSYSTGTSLQLQQSLTTNSLINKSRS